MDSLVHDGLTDVICGLLQGAAAEKTAADMKITREELDKYTIMSYERAIQANNSGFFKNQIVPYKINESETVNFYFIKIFYRFYMSRSLKMKNTRDTIQKRFLI